MVYLFYHLLIAPPSKPTWTLFQILNDKNTHNHNVRTNLKVLYPTGYSWDKSLFQLWNLPCSIQGKKETITLFLSLNLIILSFHLSRDCPCLPRLGCTASVPVSVPELRWREKWWVKGWSSEGEGRREWGLNRQTIQEIAGYIINKWGFGPTVWEWKTISQNRFVKVSIENKWMRFFSITRIISCCVVEVSRRAEFWIDIVLQSKRLTGWQEVVPKESVTPYWLMWPQPQFLSRLSPHTLDQGPYSESFSECGSSSIYYNLKGKSDPRSTLLQVNHNTQYIEFSGTVCF